MMNLNLFLIDHLSFRLLVVLFLYDFCSSVLENYSNSVSSSICALLIMETYCLTLGVLCLFWFIRWCLKYAKFLKDAKSSSVPMITASFKVAFMEPGKMLHVVE